MIKQQFFEKSSLHSGDGKTQLSSFKQTRENASRGIYINCHRLLQRKTGKQPGKPGQHFTATGNTRARAKLIRHMISLSNIFTSKLLTENGGTGVCWDQNLPLLCCKPPDINKKTAGLLTTKDCPAHPPPPVRALQPLPQRQGPNPPPSALGEPKTSDNSFQWYVSGPRYIAATFTNVYRTSENPVCL